MFDISVQLEDLLRCYDTMGRAIEALERVLGSAEDEETSLLISWKGESATKHLERFSEWKQGFLEGIELLRRLHVALSRALNLLREADLDQVGLIRPFGDGLVSSIFDNDVVAMSIGGIEGISFHKRLFDQSLQDSTERLLMVQRNLGEVSTISCSEVLSDISKTCGLIDTARNTIGAYDDKARSYREHLSAIDAQLAMEFYKVTPLVAVGTLLNASANSLLGFLQRYFTSSHLFSKWLTGDLSPEEMEALKHELSHREVVYDKDAAGNRYGGNQSAPYSLWEGGSDKERSNLARIIRSYSRYENLSDRQISDLMRKLNSEGCGYVALCNGIFQSYKDRPDEFERTFGFPMYRIDSKSGEAVLNFEYLLVDFYCSKDNHNGKGGYDTFDAREDESSTKGRGTTSSSQEYRAERYLEEHGVSADVQSQKAWDFKKHSSEDNKSALNDIAQYCAERISEGEQVYINMFPHDMIDESGRRWRGSEDSGHAISVVGVEDDGRIVLSSWGKKYYLNPDCVNGSSSIVVQTLKIGG